MNKKKILHGIVNIFVLPIVPVLFVLKYVLRIQFIRIRDGRIGHLAENTELFLRRIELGINKKKLKYIGIASITPANKQLLSMIKRRILTIRIPQPKAIKYFLKILASYSILNKWRLFYVLTFKSNEYYEFDNGKPALSFVEEEENKGKEILKEIGVDKWFICFHARDPCYLQDKYKGDTSYLHFRNNDINNMIKAAEYITEKGGYAIRMGAKVEKKLATKDPNVIDYASNYRSDFGDIYLPAKCKFFLGDGCGINQIAQIFNLPVAWANVAPIMYPPFSKRDLFIPKKIWSIEKNRLLTFKEIIDSEIFEYFDTKLYEKAKLKLIENTPEDILNITKEMYERLNGTWVTTKEDEELQKKYKSLIKPGQHCYGFTAKVGAIFLRENKDLLK
jgi:putative glycosyltransferase (TIGR04372 family)